MSLFDTAVFNSTLYEALYLQVGDTLSFARDFFELCISSLPVASLPKSIVDLTKLSFYEDVAEVFFFNEFQLLLLKTFSLILLFTFLLILISWRVYGKRISERFMKPGESLFYSHVCSLGRDNKKEIQLNLFLLPTRSDNGISTHAFPSKILCIVVNETNHTNLFVGVRFHC